MEPKCAPLYKSVTDNCLRLQVFERFLIQNVFELETRLCNLIVLFEIYKVLSTLFIISFNTEQTQQVSVQTNCYRYSEISILNGIL